MPRQASTKIITYQGYPYRLGKNGNYYLIENGDDDFEAASQKHSNKKTKAAPKAPAKSNSKVAAGKKVIAKPSKAASKPVKAVAGGVAKKNPAAKKAPVAKKVTKKATKKAPKTLIDELNYIATPAAPVEGQVIDEEALRVENAKKMERLYKKCKKFIKDFDKKKAIKQHKDDPDWKKASNLYTSAASILVRYNGLRKSDLSAQKHLPDAVGPLRVTGEKQFEEARRIIATLNAEDLAKFWTEQIRNINANTFDELITKKQYNETSRNSQLVAAVEARVEESVMAASEMPSESAAEMVSSEMSSSEMVEQVEIPSESAVVESSEVQSEMPVESESVEIVEEAAEEMQAPEMVEQTQEPSESQMVHEMQE